MRLLDRVESPADLKKLPTRELSALAQEIRELIIANMAGYRCPHCGQVSNPFDRTPSDIQTLAEALHARYLGHVPFAGPEERKQALQEILNGILRNPPVMLDKKKGGMTRWLLERTLK